MDQTIHAIVNSIIFSVIGVVMMVIAFFVFDKLTPYNLWQELVERQNTALSVVVGAITIAIAVIIASAIH